jgi:hypothetical protein
MTDLPRCPYHPDRPVAVEIEGRVLVCRECADDDDLRAHARSDWR